jgi:hypothetical protein
VNISLSFRGLGERLGGEQRRAALALALGLGLGLIARIFARKEARAWREPSEI